MKITVIGTGITEDPNRINTSYLIEHNCKTIQVDAGYNVFNPLCRKLGGFENLVRSPDMILLTHQHGDHIGSLPQEVLATWRTCNDANVTRELYITGEPDTIANFEQNNDIDYRGFMEKLYKKRIQFRVEPFRDLVYNGLVITHAPTKHSAPNYAYRFDCPIESFAISGDGQLTDETKELFRGVNTLFHDGFNVEDPHPSHPSIKELLDYSKTAGITSLCIVHMDPPERKREELIEKYKSEAASCNMKLWLAEDGEDLSFP